MPSLDSLKKNIKFEFYEREGNLFEEFVLNIYRLTHPDIRAVKPQGQKGDGANDGYISGELVLQVYAPEELKNKAIEKIEHDFERAKEYGWNYTDWHFVVNDKFKGVYPDIHQKLDELKANNPTLVSDAVIMIEDSVGALEEAVMDIRSAGEVEKIGFLRGEKENNDHS